MRFVFIALFRPHLWLNSDSTDLEVKTAACDTEDQLRLRKARILVRVVHMASNKHTVIQYPPQSHFLACLGNEKIV